jgi:hypothetical protein
MSRLTAVGADGYHMPPRARSPVGEADVGGANPGYLPVRLPDLPTVPEVWRGATYVVRSLLTHGDANPKLAKSNRAGTAFRSWGLALAAARASGYQLCSSASPGCRASCLHHQGHARLDPSIVACRVAKAVALREHRDWFVARLHWELSSVCRRAVANGFQVAVRLNLTSDVMWEKECPALFEQFGEVQFYDFTKHARRVLRWCEGQLPSNYHLTFSRSESNHDDTLAVLRAGGNVAVVFRRELPARWEGFEVIDGDLHDLRFLDPAGTVGVVVGLRAKGTARADQSGFVVYVGRFPLAIVTPGSLSERVRRTPAGGS